MPWLGRTLLVLAVAVAAGCADDDRPLREWRPEDHAHPAEPDPERTPSTSGGEPMTMARAAAALWRMRCAGCHGQGGVGDGPAAPPGAAMPDLSAAELQEGRTDAEIAEVIERGRGLMPGFGSELNERGIDALVRHVRTLRAEP